ncbi:MAG: hypothetical protein K0U68_08645 [Gammaproteobacteria bacterium]|nr:hypothetical protein [Gammaproteobacteria bacterium]
MHESREFSDDALKALKEAVLNALIHKQKLGQYAVIIRNGKPIKISPDQLPDKQSR